MKAKPKSPPADERRVLGSFLVSRRARLKPSDFGLPEGRRRTPGLRREEVAQLAAVSVSWYTWLEQGRDIGVSTNALKRISQVLRLDRAEFNHLFALASKVAPTLSVDDEVTKGLLELLEAIEPVPAYIRNGRLDILAWNSSVTELFVDFATLQPKERNTLRLLFLYPPYRQLIVDWEKVARDTLETFRAARARAEDKVPFDELADELCRESEEFRALWPDLDVKNFSEGTKRLHHPTRGPIDLFYVALAPEGRPELSFVTYIVKNEARGFRESVVD